MHHIREMFETWIRTTECDEQRENAILVRNAIFHRENELFVPVRTAFLPVLLDMAEASIPEAHRHVFTELGPIALGHACGYFPSDILTANSDYPWHHWLLKWYPDKALHEVRNVNKDAQLRRHKRSKIYHHNLKRYFGDRSELLQRTTPHHLLGLRTTWDFTLIFRRVMENLGVRD